MNHAQHLEVTWIRVPIIKLGRGREVPLAFEDVEQAAMFNDNYNYPLMTIRNAH